MRVCLSTQKYLCIVQPCVLSGGQWHVTVHKPPASPIHISVRWLITSIKNVNPTDQNDTKRQEQMIVNPHQQKLKVNPEAPCVVGPACEQHKQRVDSDQETCQQQFSLTF